MITALLDATMDRMANEISEEFEHIDNATRTALAFAKQADESATLALLHRYAARHARDYHRALDKLRQIQSERRDQPSPPQAPPSTGHRPLATDHCILQNEPKPDLTPEPSTTSEVATSHQPLGTEVSPVATHHSPLATPPPVPEKEGLRQ